MRRVLAAILLGCLAVVPVYLARPSAIVGEVRFFDIGQGDAALVSFGDNRQVLIDGGPDDRVLSGLGRAMPTLDRTIDAVILSHPHADHYRGLKPVFERYRVGTFYTSGVVQDNPEYQELLQTVRSRQVVTEHPTTPRQLSFPGGSVQFLYPKETSEGRRLANVHDATLAVMATVGSTRVLFTGDAEKNVEQELIRTESGRLRADVLKVGHHGSSTSSSLPFLQAVRPQAAIISVGAKNRYHHPAPQTTRRLGEAGIRTYRTDQNGIVTLRVTGGGWSVRTER